MTETAEWRQILKSDPCCYCGAPTEEIDHIRPKCRGGEVDWTNQTAACKQCNRTKKEGTVLAFISGLPCDRKRQTQRGTSPQTLRAREIMRKRGTLKLLRR